MKKMILPAFLLLILTAFVTPPNVTNPVDKNDFSTQFKLVYEAAKKRFATEKGAEESGYKNDNYAKKFAGTISFKNATSGIVIDADDLKYYQVIYSFSASTLEEAKSVKQEVSELVKSLLPTDYKTYSTYKPGYAGYMVDIFEYNSDIFAEVSKKPVVRVGIILVEDGKYNLEILVNEPVFKTAKDK